MEIDAKRYSVWDEIKHWMPSFLMLPVIIYWVLNRGQYTFIDNTDLVIHEAGHLVFMLFGKFIQAAGGTLMQIILPSLITFYFLKAQYKTGVQFALLWLGQNLINISVYAADARAHKLHLLGGSKVYHDWTYMLTTVGILEFDEEVGLLFFSLAILIFIFSLIMPKLMR
ncbi:MAG: hypothetical protein ACM34K_08560 [Bacillota bacterium]